MKLIEIPLDLSKPLIIRREFTINGHPQYKGQVFDWRHLAVSERKVRQLYDIRKIIHEDSVTFNDVKTEPEKPQTVLSNNVADEPQDDLTDLSMPELREIADKIGADYKVSKFQQREVIREKRGS